MTDFNCKINNTDFTKQIKIDTKINNTYQLIKNKIAGQLNLNISQFQLENLPLEDKLKYIKGNCDIVLKILYPSSDVLFQFANETIQISNCLKKDYNGVIQQFKVYYLIF